MSVLENPFFLREARAYSRRAWSPLSWFVLAAAVLPLFPLWLEQRYGLRTGGWDFVWFRGLLLATVVGCHALLCGFAGWQLGTRVFGTEHRRHTLEGLRLVSTSPWVWVLQKLVFPLYFLLLVWIAAIPGCFGLVLRGAFLPGSLIPGLILAGCAGLLSFSSALIIAPERIGLPKSSERNLPLAERLELAAIRLVPTWLTWLMLKLGYVWLIAGAQNKPMLFLARSLFGRGWIREDHAFAMLLATYVTCALTAAWAWANPSSPLANRLRSGVQLFTIGAAYLLLVGLTWGGAHWTWRAIVIGVPAVQAFRLWRDRRRSWNAAHLKAVHRKAVREDRRSQSEILAIQKWWDNPVLIRDLRVGLRGNALSWLFFKQWLVIGLISAVMGAIILGSPWAVPSRYSYEAYYATMTSILGWVAFVTVLRIGTRASNQWAGERRMNTIPQLLLSPITGRDIVHGRWAATLLEGITTAIPWILGFVFFLLVGDAGGDLGTIFSFAFWIFSLGLLLSVAMAAALRPLKGWRDCLSAHGVALGLFVGQPLMFIWGLGATPGAGSETVIGIVITLILMNALAIPALLWGASSNVETYRIRSLE